MRDDKFRAAERRCWARFGLDPSERMVRLTSGSDLRVQIVGSGPPVLVVHGVNNAAVMLAGVAALLPDFRCFLIDRPGCGLSAPYAGVVNDKDSFFDYVDGLVPQTLDALELHSASIVSTSMGGLFAIRAAALAPHRIERLVHLGWSMGAPLHKLPLVMRPVNSRLGSRVMARMPVPRFAIKPMLESIGLRGAFRKGNVPDELVDTMYALTKYTDTMANEIRVGPLVLDRMEDIVIPTDILRRVTAPSLFLWGSDDPMGGADVGEAFTASIPGATLHVVDGAGHAPWLDEPELVGSRTSTFLTV